MEFDLYRARQRIQNRENEADDVDAGRTWGPRGCGVVGIMCANPGLKSTKHRIESPGCAVMAAQQARWSACRSSPVHSRTPNSAGFGPQVLSAVAKRSGAMFTNDVEVVHDTSLASTG